jgi:hypothetical protein
LISTLISGGKTGARLGFSWEIMVIEMGIEGYIRCRLKGYTAGSVQQLELIVKKNSKNVHISSDG